MSTRIDSAPCVIEVDFDDCEFQEATTGVLLYKCGLDSSYPYCVVKCLVDGRPETALIADICAKSDCVDGWMVTNDDEVAYYAAPQDDMYYILETIFDGKVVFTGKKKGKTMNNMTTTVPAGTDSVTLHIQRNEKCSGELTLRDALLATGSDRPVRVVVNDRLEMPDGRKGLIAWEVSFAPENGNTKTGRMERVARLASATLCDAGVLLDERNVAISSDDHYAGTIILTVDANV